MPDLEDAIYLAVKAHGQQKDRFSGVPYVLHPLRMMRNVQGTELKIIAVLHDVIEDTEYTIQDLEEMGYSERICKTLDCLTKRKNETYIEFVRRCVQSPLAKQIKLADLKDNMDPERTRLLPKEVREKFEKKYTPALKLIQGTLEKDIV
jgi:(p)ppGpp synthase/HD superfamily hydrolase